MHIKQNGKSTTGVDNAIYLYESPFHEPQC